MFYKTLYTLLIIVIAFVFVVGPVLVFAETSATIGGQQQEKPPEIPAWTTAKGGFITFLQWLFPVMIAAAAVVATLSIIFAGFQWMAGAISPPQVEAAKNRISAAVLGLAVALGSWLILNTINPVFTNPTAPVGFTLQCPGGVCPSWTDVLFGAPGTVDLTPKPLGDLGGSAQKFVGSPGGQEQTNAANNFENVVCPGRGQEAVKNPSGSGAVCVEPTNGNTKLRVKQINCINSYQAMELKKLGIVQSAPERLPAGCEKILDEFVDIP